MRKELVSSAFSNKFREHISSRAIYELSRINGIANQITHGNLKNALEQSLHEKICKIMCKFVMK